MFTNLGDNCKTTAFNNGISKVVVEHKSKNAWCFLNTIIELENGEKYKFENPRKFRKGKENESDWLRNEKREGKPQKLGMKKIYIIPGKISIMRATTNLTLLFFCCFA